MQARVKILGHPVHQMLIVFPLGALGAAVVFDIVGLVSKARWHDISFWMIAFGIITGLIAAVFGLMDWLAIPRGTRAWRVGALHGSGNVVVIMLFAASWLLRLPTPGTAPTVAVLLSFLGFALAGVTGWLGGELVGRLGVGVDEGAHLNASSSLSGTPASLGRRDVR